MRILQLSKFYHPVLGGIELVAKNLSGCFVESGHEVQVMAFGRKDAQFPGAHGEAVRLFRVGANLLNAPLPAWPPGIGAAMRRYRPDLVVVHLPNPVMHEVARWFAPSGTPVVGVYHSDVVDKGFLGTLYQAYFSMSSSRYQRFLVSSPHLVHTSVFLGALDPSRVLVAPFSSGEGLSYRSRSVFNRKLVCIGRMVPYKGLDFLIQAVKGTGYELHLVGDGPLRKELSIKAPENVVFHGAVDQATKARLIDEAGVLVSASVNRAEAFGMSIVEAFESGLPVLASRLDSGVTYLVRDGITGATFPVRDATAFLAGLRHWEENPEAYAACSQGARRFYEENLNPEKFKAQVLGLLPRR